MSKRKIINVHDVEQWFGSKVDFLNYFETEFKKNTMGDFKVQASVSRRNYSLQTQDDKVGLAGRIANIYISAIQNSPKGKILKSVEFGWLLPETQAELKESVCEAVQHAALNKQIWERVNASSVSTPSFSVNNDTTNWLLSADMFGIIAKNAITNSGLGDYQIIGDSFIAELTKHDDGSGTIVLKQFNNMYKGAKLGEFDNITNAINSLVGAIQSPDLPYDKFDYVVIRNEFGEDQIWRFEGGDFSLEENWDRKDYLTVDGNRYLVYKDYILAGTQGRDGIGQKGEAGVGIDKMEYNKNTGTLTVFYTDGTKYVSPEISKAVVITAGLLSDIDVTDPTKRDVLYLVDDMEEAITIGGYKFKIGEKGIVTINSTGDMVMHPLADNVYDRLIDLHNSLESRVDTVEQTANDNFQKVGGLKLDVETLQTEQGEQNTKIEKNKKDLELAGILIDANTETIKTLASKNDYTALTTQDPFYLKVVSDDLKAGDRVLADFGTVKAWVRIVELDKVAGTVSYSYLGSWTQDGHKVSSEKVGVAHKGSTLPLEKGELVIKWAKKYQATEAATLPKDTVRFKEYVITDDRSKINELAIQTIKGEAFQIDEDSYISAIAKLAEHLNMPVPAGDTSWTQAITDHLGFDNMFAADGSWLPAARAQWAKTNLVDTLTGALNDPTTNSISFQLWFRGYKADGTLSTDLDRLFGHAEKGVRPQDLMKQFLALSEYKVSDDKVALQAFLKLVDANPGFKITNIVKSAAKPDDIKFGDKTPVSLQAGAANSKAEQKVIDDAQDKALADYKAQMVIEQAAQDKALKDFIDQDKIDEAAQNTKITKNTQDIDTKDDKAINHLAAKPGQIKVKTLTGYEWQDQKTPGQGAPVYEMLSDYAQHGNDQSFTEANGIKGSRWGFFADDNFYKPGSDHHITTTLGTIPYDITVSYTATMKEHTFVLFDIPGGVLKSNDLRINLSMPIAIRQKNQLPDDNRVKTELGALWDYHYNPTPAKLNQLYQYGYPTNDITELEWENKQFNVVGWSGKQTEILYTKHPLASWASAGKVRLYGTKDATGRIKIFVKTYGSYDVRGEDGYVAWVKAATLEEIADLTNSHAGQSGSIATLTKTVGSISQTITRMATEHESIANANAAHALLATKDEMKKANDAQDAVISDKADKATTYTKTEIDTLQTAQDADVDSKVKAAKDALTIDLTATTAKANANEIQIGLNKAKNTAQDAKMLVDEAEIAKNAAAIAGQAAALAAGLKWVGTKPATPATGDIYIVDKAVGTKQLPALVLYDGTKEVVLIDPNEILTIIRASGEFNTVVAATAETARVNAELAKKINKIAYDTKQASQDTKITDLETDVANLKAADTAQATKDAAQDKALADHIIAQDVIDKAQDAAQTAMETRVRDNETDIANIKTDFTRLEGGHFLEWLRADNTFPSDYNATTKPTGPFTIGSAQQTEITNFWTAEYGSAPKTKDHIEIIFNDESKFSLFIFNGTKWTQGAVRTAHIKSGGDPDQMAVDAAAKAPKIWDKPFDTKALFTAAYPVIFTQNGKSKSRGILKGDQAWVGTGTNRALFMWDGTKFEAIQALPQTNDTERYIGETMEAINAGLEVATGGKWMKADGRAIPATKGAAIAILGTHLPDLPEGEVLVNTKVAADIGKHTNGEVISHNHTITGHIDNTGGNYVPVSGEQKGRELTAFRPTNSTGGSSNKPGGIKTFIYIYVG